MRSNKKKEFKEEIVKEETKRISKDENLAPYSKIVEKKRYFEVRFEKSKVRIKQSVVEKLSQLTGLKQEEVVTFSFVQGDLEDSRSMSSRNKSSNLQIPQYSTSPKPKENGAFQTASVVSIPRKFHSEILYETTENNVIGNFVDVFTPIWYCIYPIYIVIGCFHIVHLLMFYIRLKKITILPGESVVLCIIILHLFIGIYGLIKFKRNDVGDFSLINMTLILTILLALLSIAIPHFESYIGKDMYDYLFNMRLFIYIYYAVLVLLYILTLIINSKGVKFYTEYHKRCSEKEIPLIDLA